MQARGRHILHLEAVSDFLFNREIVYGSRLAQGSQDGVTRWRYSQWSFAERGPLLGKDEDYDEDG